MFNEGCVSLQFFPFPVEPCSVLIFQNDIKGNAKHGYLISSGYLLQQKDRHRRYNMNIWWDWGREPTLIKKDGVGDLCFCATQDLSEDGCSHMLWVLGLTCLLVEGCIPGLVLGPLINTPNPTLAQWRDDGSVITVSQFSGRKRAKKLRLENLHNLHS